MRQPIFILLTAIGMCITATATTAATLYIAANGSGDEATIDEGVNAAANGDTLLIGPGTFSGAGNTNIRLDGKAIVIVSEFGPSSTTIDCQGLDRAFLVHDGEGSGTVIRGLTITNGNAAGRGGAISIEDSSPEICYNVIIGNHATSHGGGIAIRNGSPYVHNNTIVENSTDAQGGGIAITHTSSPSIEHNIIAYSSAGAGIACVGAQPSPVLSCNGLFGNAAGDAVCGIDAGGNGSSDPQFCGGPGSGNVLLQADSPCAAGLSACGQLVGALGVGCATVATEENTWGAIKALFQ